MLMIFLFILPWVFKFFVVRLVLQKQYLNHMRHDFSPIIDFNGEIISGIVFFQAIRVAALWFETSLYSMIFTHLPTAPASAYTYPPPTHSAYIHPFPNIFGL